MNKRIRKKQLKKLGKYVPHKDTWNLDLTIAKFILPRLELFKNVSDCYPYELNSMEEWYEILDKMIESFNIMITAPSYRINEEYKEKVKNGLDLFRKYYNDLWW